MREVALAQHDVPKHLHLSTAGRAAFIKLCDLICREHRPGIEYERSVCPGDTLAFWLGLLSSNAVTLDSGLKLDLHSLDSYAQALGEFTLDDLRKLEREATHFIDLVEQLKAVPLVCELRDRGVFGKGDLLRNRMPGMTSGPFVGILNLRRMAKMLLGDPKRPLKPDFDSYLEGVYKCIHENYDPQKKRRWRDELVADILNDLLKRPPDNLFTQAGLKQWRHRRGLDG